MYMCKSKHASFMTHAWTAGFSLITIYAYYFFFKGNGALMLRVFPYGAVQFVSYEQYKKVNTKVS